MTDDDGGLSLDVKVRARHFKFLLFVFINGIKNLVGRFNWCIEQPLEPTSNLFRDLSILTNSDNWLITWFQSRSRRRQAQPVISFIEVVVIVGVLLHHVLTAQNIETILPLCFLK